jgi:hypothetical protein
MQQKEIWKDVPGYEGLYQASNLGRIKSGIKIKNQTKSKSKKYLMVYLYKQNVKKTIAVHQVIAMTFLNHTPCGHKIVVDHIDNNPLNNNLINLQLISHRENSIKDKSKTKDLMTGVYVSNKKWYSQVGYNGKKYHLGVFKTKEEAYLKYINAVKDIEKGIFNPIAFLQKSKYKGVSFRNDRNKWFSYIDEKNKRVSLGCFNSEEEAYNAILNYKK